MIRYNKKLPDPNFLQRLIIFGIVLLDFSVILTRVPTTNTLFYTFSILVQPLEDVGPNQPVKVFTGLKICSWSFSRTPNEIIAKIETKYSNDVQLRVNKSILTFSGQPI